MSYKSSKSTGGKASSTTKSSLKGTKTVTKVSSTGSSTSVSSSGGTGGSSSIVNTASEPSTTKPRGNVRNASEPNYYPARHFYVTVGASRTPSVTALAPTVVICPLKMHLGTLGPKAQDDGVVSSNTTGQIWTKGQGYAEVMGVIPTKITRAYDGTAYTGLDLLNRIHKVTYEYKRGGHKVISVHYDNVTTGDTSFETLLHYITISVLFSDGSVVEVTQPIASAEVGLDSPIDTSESGRSLQAGGTNDFGKVGGLSWDFSGGNDTFMIISAGAFITGYYKDQTGQGTQKKKHYWWGLDGKGTRIGTLYNQQVMEIYNGADTNTGSVTQGEAGIWDWDNRYAVGNNNNFATNTGADGWEYSAARTDISSTYYPTDSLTTYNSNGQFVQTGTGTGAPKWGRQSGLNPLGYWNSNETPVALSGAPSNRFHPVNAYYTGGVGTTIEHSGMCIKVISPDGTSITNIQPFDSVSRHIRGTQLALALRALYKGMYRLNYSDFGATPQYGTGIIPSCDPYDITSEIFNNGEIDGEYCLANEIESSVTEGSASLGACNGNDNFVNLFIGNRTKSMQPSSGEPVPNEIMQAAFAASMGMLFDNNSFTLGAEQSYTDQCFKTNADTSDNKGLVLPYNKRIAAGDNGFNSEFGGDYIPQTDGDNLIGNVVISMKPFYSYVDFPVSQQGTYFTLALQPNVQDAQAAMEESVEEFTPAQGIPDYVQSTVYKHPQTGTVLNAIPTFLDLSQFPSVADVSPTNSVNHDPNSLLTDYPALDSLGYNVPTSTQTVPYDSDSGQPWGRVSGRIENQHYLAGGITYNAGDEVGNTHEINVYPKSTLTNPASLSEPAFPEIELVIQHKYNVPQLMGTITVNNQTISPTDWGFDVTNYTASQIKKGLTADGLADSSSDTLGNTTDIYNITYKPGKNPLDNASFPNNFGDVSTGSEVTGFAPEDATLNEFISNVSPTETRLLFTGETTLDKAYIDVDVEDLAMEFYNLTSASNQQFNTVSNVALIKSGMSQLGSEQTGQIGSRIRLDFPFVVFGMTEFETGPPTEEILGCTDAAANNFDELANVDDGSCIYCSESAPGDMINPFEYIVNGLSGQVLDAPTLVGNTASYGNLDVLNEDWYLGHFGNAVNYSPPSQGVAFDNQATTSQWTSFQAQFDLNTASIIAAANSAGSTVDAGEFLQYWTNSVDLDSYTLMVYKVEDFDSDQYQWAQESGTPSYNTLPVVDGAQPVVVLQNLGTDTNLKFGTQEGDVGNITLGLEAGTHYVAVLRVNIKECNEYYYHAYNFWVLYCDCDDNAALNFAGDDHPYPWSDTSAYPGGYSTTPFSFCQSTEFERRMWLKSKRSSDEAGLCLYPEPYVDCSEFIDFCITSSTFECELTGDIINGFTNIGTGSIYINVFGVYTGSDIIGQEFALVVDGILFEFILTLTDASTNEVIEQIAVNTYDDYLELTGGIQPQNVNGVNIAFNDVPQGQYIVTLDQVGGLFPGQDPTLGPCQGLEPSGTFGTINVGAGENCEDIVPGCNDPLAVNYDPNATTIVNGEPFDAYNNTCEYNDCNNVFETVRITGTTTTNSLAECATQEIDTDGDGILDDTENFLGDTNSGGATFTVFDPDGPTNFNIGVVSLSNGNESVGIATLLQFYSDNFNQITTNNGTTGVLIPQGGTVVGAFLPTNVTTVPEGTFSVAGMYAGNYLAFALPQTLDPDFPLIDCETQLLEFADQFENFTILLDASAIVDCSEPCNEVTNPADCDDYVPGCTDVSATNFNELANYDDGSCEYGGTETCITNPELPECEECEDEEGIGLRNCDETFGNTEGCGDPAACNYNPDALIVMNSLCEYCCDGDENCVENEDEDDCEDADGNVDPNCTEPICPDPLNPDCDTVVVNPCPTEADCPPPPIPDCIALGNCGDGGPGTEDPDVIIDDVVTVEVSCDPLFNNQEFDTWRTEAMTCSATEGSKMLFKLRAGVKDHNEQDLIKLTLINYLFNQGVDLPCLFSCDEYDNNTQNIKYREKDCASEWKRFGSQRWTPKSTFNQGDVVRILRNVRGKATAAYFIAKKDVPAQQIRPDQRGIDNEYWVRCINVRGQKSTTPNGVTYLRTLYEFMRKFCENCSIVSLGSGAAENNTKSPSIDSTGLMGDDDSEIIF
tara:strand:+ start:609 stop:7013 length:6405 start_codon:yes stop_codon:yes gene_type:complete